MKKFLMMAAVAAVMAAPAMAQDAPKPEMGHEKGDRMMAKVDTDGNGMISKAEWTAESDSKFAAADTNKDGQISKEERMEMRKHWRDHKGEKPEMTPPAK